MAEHNGDRPPPGTLTIEYDPLTTAMRWRLDGSIIPPNLLVNTLELIKAQFVGVQLKAAAVAALREQQSGIVGPDGSPAKRF